MVRVTMDSVRHPKKRKLDWFNTLLNSEFFGPCVDHTDYKYEKKEKNVFCIDCSLCCCKSCMVSMAHFEHRSLQILKFFNQEHVCLRDIQMYFDCSEIQTCKVRGEIAVLLNSGPPNKTRKALRSNIHRIDCEACGRRIQIQDSPKRFCSIACKLKTTVESGGADTCSSTDVDGSPDCAPSLVSGTQKSAVDTEKLVINFDLKGNPIGPNKNKLLTRSLALVKVIVGVAHEDWKKVPNEKKDDLWENISHEFDIPLFHKENVLSQAQVQWKTWKTNIRKNYFGNTREEILVWKDNVPPKEGIIPVSQWNIFVEREATPQKLDERAQMRANRAKKTDVHTLGRKSYAQVAEEWAERTVGTEDEGLEPNRVNLYLHARKNKHTGEFHSKVAKNAARIAEIRSHQDAYSQADLETDALTQVLGKDKRGPTCGMGRICKTKLKAIRPLVSELEKVTNDMNEQKSKMVNVESSFSEKMDTIINLLQNRTPQQFPFSFAGTSRSIPTQAPSSSAIPRQNAPRQVRSSSATPIGCSSSAAADTGYHHMRDLQNLKPVALGKIEEMGPGKTMDNRPMVAHEAKVRVICIYPGNEKEQVYLGKQGSADNMGGCAGSYVVWPIYLLEKIV